MRKPRTKFKPQRNQLTPDELLARCLDFLQRKFYPNHAVAFAKDRPRLLSWIVLWPAKWLDQRGVTLPPDRYAEIFFKVFQDAQMFGTDKITYLPAWLAKCLQSHFDHHGEDYYEEAKSMRNLVETALFATGKPTQTPAPDPVRDLAAAARLLKPQKHAPKRPLNDQLSLL